jgi:hypothetical protein
MGYKQLALLVSQVLLSSYLLENISLSHPTVNIEHQQHKWNNNNLFSIFK